MDPGCHHQHFLTMATSPTNKSRDLQAWLDHRGMKTSLDDARVAFRREDDPDYALDILLAQIDTSRKIRKRRQKPENSCKTSSDSQTVKQPINFDSPDPRPGASMKTTSQATTRPARSTGQIILEVLTTGIAFFVFKFVFNSLSPDETVRLIVPAALAGAAWYGVFRH